MSGYRGNDRHGDRRDNRRDDLHEPGYGRDDRRDRSSRYGRDDRRDRSPGYGRASLPGATYGRERSPLPRRVERPQPPHENLPVLPDRVNTPKGGAEPPLQEMQQRGKAGRIVKLETNHFRILSFPTFTIYVYRLRFIVPPSSQRKGEEKANAIQRAMAMTQTFDLLGKNASRLDFYFMYLC